MCPLMDKHKRLMGVLSVFLVGENDGGGGGGTGSCSDGRGHVQ